MSEEKCEREPIFEAGYTVVTKYVCNLCGKKFKNKDDYDEHIECHDLSFCVDSFFYESYDDTIPIKIYLINKSGRKVGYKLEE